MIPLSLSLLFRRRTGADAAQAEGAASKLLIVPRALSPAYYFFLRAFAKENLLNVIVDRREGERRGRPRPVFGDRRHDDRRHKPSTTWDRDGFIVAPAREPGKENASPVPPARPAGKTASRA